MRARVLTSRPIRVFLLFVVAAVAASVLVVFGLGGQRRAEAAVSPGTTELVSVGDREPIAPSGEPSISADGRYVAFASTKSFDPLDVLRHGESDLDVYVRDRWAHRTILLSHGVVISPEKVLGTRGLPKVLTVPADGASQSPSISADGRYVAFQTTATNLGPRDFDHQRDIVVVDRDPDGNGVFDERNCLLLRLYCHEFTRISPGRTDDQGRPITGASAPRISADGSSVVWVATQGGTAAHTALPQVIYRSTLTKGPTGAIVGVRSQQVHAVPGEDLQVRNETAPALSGDGKRLVMSAQVWDGENEDTARTAVLGVDLSTPALPDTGGEGYAATRFDVDGEGKPLDMPIGWDPDPTINFNGRQIAFCAPGADSHVVLAVRWEGPEPPRSELISSDPAGKAVNGGDPALSANGRYLAFTSWSRTIHNGVDGPDTSCDPLTGQNTEPGGSGLLPSLPELPSLPPIIGGPSSPGTSSPPPQLRVEPPAGPAPPDSSHCDIVVRDLGQDRARAAAGLPRLPAELASPSLARNCVPDLAPDATCEGDEASRNPVLSADGSVVAFESQAATLVPDDPNGTVQDVFARTFTPRLTGAPVDFFTVAPGSSTLGSADLRHQGFGPLPVQSLAITGPNAAAFTLTAETCVGRVLQAGEGCLASIRFTPPAVGRFTAVLEVRYVGLASPLFVPLSGSGDTTPPRAVTVMPTPLAFGDQLPLSQNPPGAVTVRNTGDAPLKIDRVSLPPNAGAGKHPEDYTVLNDGCTGRTLQPGQTCTVTLRHSPQGVGPRPAVLRFDDNAPNGPHLASLEGGGITPRLEFNPAVVPVGRVTTVFGFGFAPQRPVNLTLRGFPEALTVVPDAGGNFATPLLIFPNDIEGQRTGDAVITGSQGPISATADLLVVPGTVDPPDFVTRH